MRAIHFDDLGEPSHVAEYAIERDLLDNGGVPVSYEVSDQEVIETFYLSKSGEVRRRIPRPSQYHKWDPDSEAWFEDTEKLRSNTLWDVDIRAETVRHESITPGFGQIMTYEAKYQEALSGGGPILEAEAEALGEPLESVVTSVLEARSRWEQIGAKIEAARIKAKRDIRQAETSQEIYAAVDQLDQTLAQL